MRLNRDHKVKYKKPRITSKRLSVSFFSNTFSTDQDEVLLALCYGCTSCNCGNPTCIEGYCSDKRLKQKITGIGSVSSKINRLNGVYFEWNKKGKSIIHSSHNKEIGLIAQQVKEVFPELVVKRNDDYLAIDYPKLTAVLIEAVKELQKKQTVLEAKLSLLNQQKNLI
ncbi:MAG: tail fiber domain-containing protein [Bacteroidota bacterium]